MLCCICAHFSLDFHLFSQIIILIIFIVELSFSVVPRSKLVCSTNAFHDPVTGYFVPQHRTQFTCDSIFVAFLLLVIILSVFVLAVHADTMLLLRMLYSFSLFHFPAETCADCVH